jgi:hypothetical protein
MRRIRLTAAIAAVALLLGACNGMNLFQPPDDKAIISDIQAKLFQDPVLKTRDVRVDSQKGVVILSGSVATNLEKSSVERFAGQASGVKQVINQLTFAGAAVAPEAAAQPAQEPPSARPAKRRSARHAHPENAAPAPVVASTELNQSAEPPTRAEAAPPPPPPPVAPPPRQPVQITVPSGTVISVRMIDSIDSQLNHPGEEFSASLEAPVVVSDKVVIPQGSDARVRLVESRSAGHMTGSSELQLELIALNANGNSYNVTTGYYVLQGASRGKRTAETVGGGAGLGALIGAIVGRGKGAAIGAAVGAGAGTATQAATKGQQVKVASETKIDFTLKAPFTVAM